MRIGLLMCGHVHPDALDIGGDYPELFAALFDRHGVELVRYDADLGRLPDSIDECDGWITSPARVSVTDAEQWIRDTESLVRELVERERPFAGVCFGHQLLASALGGRVERAPGGWGVGVKEYEVVSPQWWMDPPRWSFALVASHEDQVVELPRGAELVARSSYCPNAAFHVGARAIAIQAHPEFPAELSARLLMLREGLIGIDAARQARGTLDIPVDRELVVGWIVRFFAGRDPRRPR